MLHESRPSNMSFTVRGLVIRHVFGLCFREESFKSESHNIHSMKEKKRFKISCTVNERVRHNAEEQQDWINISWMNLNNPGDINALLSFCMFRKNCTFD